MTTRNGEPPLQRIEHLQPEQLSVHIRQPVTRATLSPRVQAGLWVLRVFVIFLSVLVVYTFISQL